MENDSINILKIFFAYSVIASHTGLFSDINPVLHNVTGVIWYTSVPFFLLASTYFLGKNKKNCEKGWIKDYLCNAIKPYIFWGLFYTIIETVKDLILKQDYLENIKRFFLGVPSGAMWFLSALIVSVIIISFIKSKKCLKILIFLSGILYIGSTFLCEYSGQIHNEGFKNLFLAIYNNNNVINNVLFSTLVFSALGFYIGKYKEVDKNKTKNIVGLIVGIIIVIIELIIISKIKPIVEIKKYIGTILIAYNLFILSIKIEFKCTWNSKILRKLSTALYYSHSFFNLLITFVFTYVLKMENTEIKFLLVSFITTIFGLLVLKLDNKKLKQII